MYIENENLEEKIGLYAEPHRPPVIRCKQEIVNGYIHVFLFVFLSFVETNYRIIFEFLLKLLTKTTKMQMASATILFFLFSRVFPKKKTLFHKISLVYYRFHIIIHFLSITYHIEI